MCFTRCLSQPSNERDCASPAVHHEASGLQLKGNCLPLYCDLTWTAAAHEKFLGGCMKHPVRFLMRELLELFDAAIEGGKLGCVCATPTDTSMRQVGIRMRGIGNTETEKSQLRGGMPQRSSITLDSGVVPPSRLAPLFISTLSATPLKAKYFSGRVLFANLRRSSTNFSKVSSTSSPVKPAHQSSSPLSRHTKPVAKSRHS